MIIIRLKMNDATIDGDAERGKFSLVLGLNVVGRIIGMEIESYAIDVEIEQLELFERVIEQRTVIGFEL